jgi:predicted Zn-dependent peptidase
MFYPVAMIDEPAVYIINTPKARQSGVNVYIDCGEIDSERDRTLAQLFNMYVGGSMNSMMFRELREFRSFAYSASSRFMVPRRPADDHTAVFACYLTTQSDKTMDALGTLDSLIVNMEFTQEQFESARTQIINDMHNGYPAFRSMGYVVDTFLEDGYTQDPREERYSLLSELTLDDLREFYVKRVKDSPRVVAVTTDTKQLKPEEFASYGNVEVLKAKDVLRK